MQYSLYQVDLIIEDRDLFIRARELTPLKKDGGN